MDQLGELVGLTNVSLLTWVNQFGLTFLYDVNFHSL